MADTIRRRRRDTTGSGQIPPEVASWFAGRAWPTPWVALLEPVPTATIIGWWRQWVAEHPGATPPDAPWIDWSARLT